MNPQLKSFILYKLQDAISEIIEEHRLQCVKSDTGFKLVMRSKKKSASCILVDDIFKDLPTR